MNPTVAVVIPVRNGRSLIRRAVASALAQSRLPDEIVVVDDGSTDGTGAVVREFGEGVTLIETPQQGVAAARNTGVAAASSDFVAFLDADDYWEPDHLERIETAIKGTEGRATIYFSDLRLAQAHGGATIWAHCGLAVTGPYELREESNEWLFASRQPMLIQASVVSHQAYTAVGGCDPRLTRRSDTHLIFKLGLSGPTCAVSGVSGEWTAENRASLTHRYTPTHTTYEECTVRLYRDLLERAVELNRGERRILRRAAARAHLSLAKEAGLRRPRTFLANAIAACRMDPRTPVAACGRVALRLGSSRTGQTAAAPEARGGELTQPTSSEARAARASRFS